MGNTIENRTRYMPLGCLNFDEFINLPEETRVHVLAKCFDSIPFADGLRFTERAIHYVQLLLILCGVAAVVLAFIGMIPLLVAPLTSVALCFGLYGVHKVGVWSFKRSQAGLIGRLIEEEPIRAKSLATSAT